MKPTKSNFSSFVKILKDAVARTEGPLVATQRFFENPPQFSFANQVQEPVPRFAAQIPQEILNIPSRSIRNAAELGNNISYGKTTPQNITGNLAGAAELPLFIASLGGLGAIRSAAQQGLLNTIKAGAIAGGKAGTGYGLLSGLEKGKNAQSVKDQVFNYAAPSALFGGVSGGVIGGALAGGGYGVNKVAKMLGNSQSGFFDPNAPVGLGKDRTLGLQMEEAVGKGDMNRISQIHQQMGANATKPIQAWQAEAYFRKGNIEGAKKVIYSMPDGEYKSTYIDMLARYADILNKPVTPR